MPKMNLALLRLATVQTLPVNSAELLDMEQFLFVRPHILR